MGAAIDIGSNSVHLLAARARRPVRRGTNAELVSLVDASDLIGLGDNVDGTGVILAEPLQAVIDSLRRLVALAEQAGAGRVEVVGTEPLRRASNADELRAAIERFTGLTLHVLTERQEAELTFLGVSGGQAPGEPLAIVDIGGGSTEVSIHVPGDSLRVIPLPFGSARLTNAVVCNDPPTTDELAALADAARQVVAAAPWPEHHAMSLRRAVFVGGTATNVARLGTLDRANLDEDMGTLARLTADEVVERFAVRPRRARQLAAGVAIVSALLDRFLLDHAEVSEASLRDGAIIASLALGKDWLSQLDGLVA